MGRSAVDRRHIVHGFHDKIATNAESLVGWLQAELIATAGGARIKVAQGIESVGSLALVGDPIRRRVGCYRWGVFPRGWTVGEGLVQVTIGADFDGGVARIA